MHSSGLREEIHDVYADPTYKIGDYVVIIADTRPGICNIFSYDKEGKVTKVVDGKGASPNRYIVKLLHERGSEKVDELYLMPIDQSLASVSYILKAYILSNFVRVRVNAPSPSTTCVILPSLSYEKLLLIPGLVSPNITT